MVKTAKNWNPLVLACFACSLIFISGCGNDGVQRYNLSGAVTYQGQPVPAGTIVFEPDSSKGNSGPQGAAKIENGHYSTNRFGRGAVSGPLTVRISGTMQPDGGDDASEFLPTYMTTIDLPEEASVFDFEIPSKEPTRGK